MATTFCTPLNQLACTLAAAHVAGSGTLVLAAGYGDRVRAELAALGAAPIAAGHPVRVSVVFASHAADVPILPAHRTVFRATVLVGDVLGGCLPIEGTADRDYAAGDVVRFNATAGAAADQNGAIVALEADLATTEDALALLTATVATKAPLASPTFTGTVTIAALAGLLKGASGVVTTAVAGTDYLTPTGSGSGLTGVVKAIGDPIGGATPGRILLAGAGGILADAAYLTWDGAIFGVRAVNELPNARIQEWKYYGPYGAAAWVENDGKFVVSSLDVGNSIRLLSAGTSVEFSPSGNKILRDGTTGRVDFLSQPSVPAAAWRFVSREVACPLVQVQGMAGQAAPLVSLLGITSTSAVQAQATLDATWVDATDATRKARVTLAASDWTGPREGLRVEADGTQAITTIPLLGPHGGTRLASNSGAFDLAVADWFFRTLDGTNGTLTVSNERVGQLFTVELLQDGTGSRTVSWASFGTVTWMTTGGTAPTIAAGANLRTTLLFKRLAAGTFLGWLTGSQA